MVKGQRYSERRIGSGHLPSTCGRIPRLCIPLPEPRGCKHKDARLVGIVRPLLTVSACAYSQIARVSARYRPYQRWIRCRQAAHCEGKCQGKSRRWTCGTLADVQDRKQILQQLRKHVEAMSKDGDAQMVLFTAFDCVE